MKFLSEQEGRPIYEDREFVRIFVPGDTNTVLERQVTEHDKDRFAQQYAIFKRTGSGDEQVIGTPLSQLPWLTPSQIKQMQALNIRTVEHLAGLSDTSIQALGMGGRELKAKAQAYLDTAADGAEAAKYAAQNEQMKSEIEDLKAQIKELAALADNQKRKSAA